MSNRRVKLTKRSQFQSLIKSLARCAITQVIVEVWRLLRQDYEFWASLSYIENSRQAWIILRNPVPQKLSSRSILRMFFSPKPWRRGPSSPIPLTACAHLSGTPMKGWAHLQSGGQGSLSLCHSLLLLLAGRQLLNANSPPPPWPPNICPGSHSHSQRLPAMLTHVFFSQCSLCDGNKMTVQEGNMEAHTCDSSNQETEAGGLHILG